jgi:hypothetical protein|tara:strand:- start:98 stop:286 length:189 start_codon:yes stop_codon:yes gene_type:complete
MAPIPAAIASMSVDFPDPFSPARNVTDVEKTISSMPLITGRLIWIVERSHGVPQQAVVRAGK